MPLFIDYHQLEEGLTIEDVRKAHRSDLVNQEKHDVKYLQFWVNEKNSMVFCLIEGPDSEACVKCHLESHGNTPCNIQEVEPGFFELIMGTGLSIDNHHMTLNENGEADPANRIVLVAQYPDFGTLNGNEQRNEDTTDQAKNMLIQNVSRTQGRLIEFSADESMVAVFDSPVNALQCIKNINLTLGSSTPEHNRPAGKFALFNGLPLTYKGSFFHVAIKHAKILCSIAESGQLVISAGLKDLMSIDPEVSEFDITSSRILKRTDEKFIIELFQTTEQNLASELFNVNHLTRQLGISRTKLYRKATLLTGKTPNQLIRDLRMRKALNLIRNNEGNIACVSYEVGYSNPSYFSRIFRETYGCPPSQAYPEGAG